METVSEPQIISIKSSFETFRKLFIVFWIFSFLGHYLEIIWSWFNHMVFGSSLWVPTVPTILPLAPPYGLGVVAVIVLTWPFVKRHEFNPFQAFAMNVIISAIVEYLSAMFLVLVDGYNKFWNYSNQPFNLNGYICLENSLLFGVGVTIFLYYIYPLCNKIYNKFKQDQIDVIFWVLFIFYGIDLIFIN